MTRLRFLTIVTCVLAATCWTAASAQNFTDALQSSTEGQGVITVTQDSILEGIVNGTIPVETAPKDEKKNDFDIKKGTKHRMRGYRIQVFWGGSSRNDQMQAERMKVRAESAFPQFRGYVGYESPHWHCRVGDFKTRAEAADYVIKMRSLNKEAMIVPSEIVVYKEENK
jgi:hypothetical protein